MIEINNLTKFKIDKKKFEKIVKAVLRGEKKSLKSDISVAIVNPSKIKSLNKKYRKKNKTTDVLSFAYSVKRNVISGEIIICSQVVKKNAKEFGNNASKELIRVLIHGVLHILGYDHEKSSNEAKKMQRKGGFYENKIKIK